VQWRHSVPPPSPTQPALRGLAHTVRDSETGGSEVPHAR
jgi:hypothetical protein